MILFYLYYSPAFLWNIATVTIETNIIAVFAAIVPVQDVIMVAKIEEAALNRVWNSTHINT